MAETETVEDDVSPVDWTKIMAEAQAKAEAEAAAAEKAAAADALAESLKTLQSAPAEPILLPTPTRLIVVAGTRLFEELRAAGLGEGVSITPDAVEISPAVDDETLGKIKKVVDAHNPTNMAILRKQAFDTAMLYGNGLTAQVTRRYADVEVQSWTAQEIEARAIDAGGEVSATSLLAPLAEDKGVSVQVYAKSVIEKADQYRLIAIAGVKLRRGAEELLSEQLDTPEKLGVAVDALKTQARTYIDQFGLEA